jgi:hypothetical protein
MPVIQGAASYPEHLEMQIANKGAHLLAFDALELAQQAGSSQSSKCGSVGCYGITAGY